MRTPLITSITCLLVSAIVAPGGSGAQASPNPRVGLDHVIIRTGILRQGIAEFARVTGVTPSFGGKHPGRGTQNALVSLGQGRYLELLAPVVDSSAAGPLLVEGWALHTDQLDSLADFLRAHGQKASAASPGSRRLPNGSVLEWTTAGMLDSGYIVAPFFIQWGRGSAHPSSTSPSGCTLERFTVTDTPPYRTIDLLETIAVDVSTRRGSRPGFLLVLLCPKGRVTFGS